MRSSGAKVRKGVRQVDASRRLRAVSDPYSGFSQINGDHSFKNAVPNGYVDYQARKRHCGKVTFFNFELAKEMGVISEDHPHSFNEELVERILDTFALVIINEWDLEHKRKFPKEDIKPNRYMATRYLQLQHPGKRGTTSGDGRGIWNGEFKGNGVVWDISSSGTGATCLSPAVAIEKRNFKTGDRSVCYGNGLNTIDDGINTALMSEVLHLNGVSTERTLTIIEFPGGSSINVRAAKNLLRPSHFFSHLKQGNYDALKGAVDYFVQRQILNGDWSKPKANISVYEHFARELALSFSKLAAQFESEYIFCWMDWDGDNILANAGIIDYGSVRQFGLFHSEYRYDDYERFSTKLTEQRFKARYLVQTFAQIRSFLMTGQKKNLKSFSNDALLSVFDKNFEYWMDAYLLRRMGLDHKGQSYLMERHRAEVSAFRSVFTYFERAQSKRGVYPVSDGVTSDAIFNMRTCLRELPKHFLKEGPVFMEPKAFIRLIKSSYAKRADLRIGSARIKKIQEFQDCYLKVLTAVSKFKDGGTLQKMLLEVTMRSSLLNRPDRITGDAVIFTCAEILRLKKHWSQDDLQRLIERFIQTQIMDPVRPALHPQSYSAAPNGDRTRAPQRDGRALAEALDRLCAEVVDRREGL